MTHAERVSWSGALVVPGVGMFDGSASGVFRLLADLDRQCRGKVAGATGETP